MVCYHFCKHVCIQNMPRYTIRKLVIVNRRLRIGVSDSVFTLYPFILFKHVLLWAHTAFFKLKFFNVFKPLLCHLRPHLLILNRWLSPLLKKGKAPWTSYSHNQKLAGSLPTSSSPHLMVEELSLWPRPSLPPGPQTFPRHPVFEGPPSSMISSSLLQHFKLTLY